MKRRISRKELKQIRKAVEALPGRYGTGEVIPVSIALPDPCDNETRQYAHQLIVGLRTVKCEANISFILSFSRYVTSDKPYEVLREIPLATPCIRVYAQKGRKSSTRYQRLTQSVKQWWNQLRLKAVAIERAAA